MLVSVCMIVRNEAAILETAIESTRGLADEIVIMDTGSSDSTSMIAQNLGAKVLTGGDWMHKGKARNAAIEAANGDWVVILDADERIANPVGLRTFLETTDARAVFIKLTYMNADNQPTLSFSQQRCWRRGTYLYKYRAHEVPLPIDGWGKQAYTDFVWEHRPPNDRVWKSDYTLNRLLLDIEENPGISRPLYYLGRQYMYRKEWAQARNALLQYLDKSGRDEGDAWHCLSICHNGLGDKQARIRALYQAIATQTDRREWWCELAGIYHADGKDNIALGLLRCALEQPAPARGYIRHGWYGAAIQDLTARCLWKLGQYEEGHQYAQRAIDLEPDNKRLQRNLLWFESALGDMDAFYTLYGPNIHSNAPRHAAIAELVEGPDVLDVGCGTGDLLLLLQECDSLRLYGTDISSVAIDMARARGVTATLFMTGVIQEGRVNTIVMSQILEHIENPALFIRRAKSHLAADGLLIATVPRNGRIPSLDHKRDYTEESLAKLLSVVGTVKIQSWPGERDRILAVVRNE